MSREEGFQEATEEALKYPWYYRDVPIGVILSFILLVAIATLAVELRPFLTAPPVTVVAPGETAPPWKAPLPDQLPMPSFQTIPLPPVIPPPTASHSAIDAILSKNVMAPEPPKDPAGYRKKQ